MKIPKKLKIGGHIYKIKVCDLQNQQIDGDHNTENNTIRIRETLPKDQQEATLIHECLHALNAVWGERETAHMFLDSLAEQIYQLLSDNKMLK